MERFIRSLLLSAMTRRNGDKAMPLSIQSAGLLEVLAVLKSNWMPGMQIGLGSADITPDQTTTIAALIPCTFSGYPGLLTLGFWGSITLVGPRAVMLGPPIIYTHSGGPLAQTVITYYITDVLGTLLFSERLPDGPAPLFRAGQTLTVRPSFSFRSEF